MLIRRVPSFPSWTPAFRELDDARREMARLFDSLTGFTGPQPAGVFPALNVSETGEAVFVRAELPGVAPGDLDITVENNTLTVAGERKRDEQVEGVSYHRREREWGKFRRSFTLPTRVDAGAVAARYENGVLTIELSKAAEVRPRQITVQASA